jgi:hypothetical protein
MDSMSEEQIHLAIQKLQLHLQAKTEKTIFGANLDSKGDAPMAASAKRSPDVDAEALRSQAGDLLEEVAAAEPAPPSPAPPPLAEVSTVVAAVAPLEPATPVAAPEAPDAAHYAQLAAQLQMQLDAPKLGGDDTASARSEPYIQVTSGRKKKKAARAAAGQDEWADAIDSDPDAASSSQSGRSLAVPAKSS